MSTVYCLAVVGTLKEKERTFLFPCFKETKPALLSFSYKNILPFFFWLKFYTFVHKITQNQKNIYNDKIFINGLWRESI